MRVGPAIVAAFYYDDDGDDADDADDGYNDYDFSSGDLRVQEATGSLSRPHGKEA